MELESKIELLLYCSKFGALDRVKSFVEIDKININSVDSRGFTALHEASCGGKMEVVLYLISRGAEVNKRVESRNPSISGTTPLASSVVHGHLDVAKFLIERGAKLDFVVNGFNILDLAVESDCSEMIEFVLSKGYLVNSFNSLSLSPLIVSLTKNKVTSTKFLLEHGADYRFRSNDGIPVLFYPIQMANKDASCMEVLLDYIRLKEGIEGLLEYINARNPSMERTALHIACLRHNHTAAKILIRNGADPNIRDKTGNLPRDLLSISGSTHISRQIDSIFNQSKTQSK